MPRYFVVCLLCFFSFKTFAQLNKRNSAKISFGTTILAFLTPDTAWLAADTKLGEVDTDTYDTTYLKQTKIYKNKNTYYGFCGISDFNSTDGLSFEPQIILDSLLKNKKSLDEIVHVFNEISFKKVNGIANWLYKNSRNEYNNNIGIVLFEYVLMGYENKKLQCFTMAYEVDSIPIGSDRIKKSKEYFYTGDTTMFFVGYAKEIREVLANGQYHINIADVKNELPCLIKKEADLYKTKVGMPVDEFVIYINAYNFFKDLECTKGLTFPKE